MESLDDAGVYKLSDDLAIIQTVDFFTPIVDNPYDFGQIAVANALSDVYAMGGKPLTALNICCFSPGVDAGVLAEVLQGGADKIEEAGAVLVGGHTVSDPELKYGVSVTGFIHPDKVLTNAGAKPGDVLVLTKPVGTGVMSTAFKNDAVDEAGLHQAVESMTTLNKTASEIAQRVGVHACTDVTGFSVLGHAYEMASASGVQCRIYFSAIPWMDGLMEWITKEYVPGGTYANRRHFGQWVAFHDHLSEEQQLALFDPQTSGGLLVAVAKEKAGRLIAELKQAGVLRYQVIGQVVPAGTEENVINVMNEGAVL